MEAMNVLGVRVDRVDMQTACRLAQQGVQGKKAFVVITPNSEIVMKAKDNAALFSIIEGADLVVPDGIGLVLASKILKRPLKERVTGIDLMQNLLRWASDNDKTVYFLGGKPGIAQKAADKVQSQYPALKIVGTGHGYFKGIHTGNKGHQEEENTVSQVAEAKPDLLFVALGAPGQEYFIDTYKDRLHAGLLMGVGGSFDVLSGEVQRAPQFYRKYGLEWFYRLIKEPWRIGRMMSLPLFMLTVIFTRGKYVQK
ncbi:WecB/TagA/CpsF family glycosyltransferase [Filifactor villosus]|uniref:N-acetylglucosaminyldiphosphoundecaprenol N-acetyl-beta-D-mannosaminyltransferase n=1 Tax=Filifactor villosus TaxID=29374 RepID=A0ABV9QJ61_9FIRM